MKIKIYLLILILSSCSFYTPKDYEEDDDNDDSSVCSGTIDDDDFQSGRGTSDDPYIICSRSQFVKIREDSSGKYYKLGQDIEWEDSTEAVYDTFSGTLDGDYKEISDTATPLIATIAFGAIVKNLALTGVTINNYNSPDLGALVRYNYGEIISCSASGQVTSDYNQVGGLVGYSSGSVKKSFFNGFVSGGDTVGGLVGYNQGTIENSYATGDRVEGNQYIGGLVGSNSSIITNSYSSMSLIGANLNRGGFVGINSGSCTSCYWDSEITSLLISGCGEGKNTSSMKQQSTYIDWDFDGVWEIDEGNSYPSLK